MKKYLFIFLLAGCQKSIDKPVKEFESNKAEITTGPDLGILELSYDYDGFSNGLGLLVANASFGVQQITVTNYQSVTFGFPLGQSIRVLRYNCPIENKAPQGNDFIIDLSESGVQNGTYGYNIKGMLAISLFKDGLPVMPELKQNFLNQTTAFKIGYDWSIHRSYQWDTSFIHAQGADQYINMVQIPEGDGDYILAVQVNPDRVFYEVDYNNNIGVLPVSIVNGIASINPSITAKAHAATNFTYYYSGRGREKFVSLDWDCPYHEPIYVNHSFTVKKNGVVIAENIKGSEYTDIVPGSFKGAVYEVIINVPGLSDSNPVALVVKK